MANVILSQALVDSWVSNPLFFKSMPEFNVIKAQKDAYDAPATKGCSSCKKRRQTRTVFNNAIAILLSLNPAALQRLKTFTKVTQIQYRGLNPITKQYEVKIL